MKQPLNWKEGKHCERKLKRTQFEIEATGTEKVLREEKNQKRIKFLSSLDCGLKLWKVKWISFTFLLILN